MNNKRIFLSSPHMSGNEIKYIQEAFDSNWIAPLGPNVDAFEKEMSTYLGGRHALAMSSGTAALHIALKLVGLKEGDEVFCSSLTFIASANPIVYEKGIPVFIDSDLETWNMCPKALELALEDRRKKNKLPKAVVAVDLFGQSADYDLIVGLCEKYNVPLIEDAAEALGASYKGKKCGNFGKLAVLSFNGNKIITTGGGGMLLSDNPDHLKKAKFWITQARDPAPHYEHSEIGYNYRLSNILAGIGRGQLEVLDERVAKRREIFETYKKELAKFDFIKFMPEPKGYFSNRWLSAFYFSEEKEKEKEKRNIDIYRILKELEKENIEARPIWKPLHNQPVFKGTDFFTSSKIPVSEILFKNGLCLPSSSNLTEEKQEMVISFLKRNF